MKKLIIIVLMFTVSLCGSVEVRTASQLSSCNISQCRSDCWQRNNKCKNRCMKTYGGEGDEYWDCLHDCYDISEQCYDECDRHCK